MRKGYNQKRVNDDGSEISFYVYEVACKLPSGAIGIGMNENRAIEKADENARTEMFLDSYTKRYRGE